MNGVIGGTDLLLSHSSTLTSDQRELIGIIKTSGESMLTLINDILDISRVEVGKLELNIEPFKLKQVAENTLDVLGKNKKYIFFHHDSIC
jgi:signal transduction histidine kinase